jgi:phosphate uptake regulator
MDSTIRSIEKAGGILNRMHKDAIEAVFTKNLALAEQATSLYRDAETSIRTAERGLVNAKPETIDRLATVVSALKAMSEINVDIADLAVTR